MAPLPTGSRPRGRSAGAWTSAGVGPMRSTISVQGGTSRPYSLGRVAAEDAARLVVGHVAEALGDPLAGVRVGALGVRAGRCPTAGCRRRSRDGDRSRRRPASTPRSSSSGRRTRSASSTGRCLNASPNLRVLCAPTHFSSMRVTMSGTHQAPFSAIEYFERRVALEHAGQEQHPQRAGPPTTTPRPRRSTRSRARARSRRGPRRSGCARTSPASAHAAQIGSYDVEVGGWSNQRVGIMIPFSPSSAAAWISRDGVVDAGRDRHDRAPRCDGAGCVAHEVGEPAVVRPGAGDDRARCRRRRPSARPEPNGELAARPVPSTSASGNSTSAATPSGVEDRVADVGSYAGEHLVVAGLLVPLLDEARRSTMRPAGQRLLVGVERVAERRFEVLAVDVRPAGRRGRPTRRRGTWTTSVSLPEFSQCSMKTVTGRRHRLSTARPVSVSTEPRKRGPS